MTAAEVVLVTGARKGIGRYLAEHFVRRGAAVEGGSREPADWHLDGYTHHLCDIGNEEEVKALMADISGRHGRLDVTINNAGTACMNHVLLTPLGSVDRIFRTNFAGTFLVCRESAKLMRARNYGRIVNITTVAVPMRLAGEAVYASSKSAVVTFTEVLARELADFGITCNCVGPSPIDTDLIRSVPHAKIRSVIDGLAIKRPGTFEDVANVVDFFVKPESSYITGQTIYLGGA